MTFKDLFCIQKIGRTENSLHIAFCENFHALWRKERLHRFFGDIYSFYLVFAMNMDNTRDFWANNLAHGMHIVHAMGAKVSDNETF